MRAAENLVFDQNLDKDTEADDKAIALVIKEYLERAIEDTLNNPGYYLKGKDWKKVNRCFVMNYSAYQKLMDRDILYIL